MAGEAFNYPITPEMIAKADEQFEALSGVEDWSRDRIDHERWRTHVLNLEERRSAASETQREAANTFVNRTAAVDSGAIEALYETDRGFTLSFAIGGATWEEAAAEKPTSTRLLVEAQATGMELALDAATKQTPVSEAFIRRVHEVVCAPQETHPVLTPVGPQQNRLVKGAYKTEANHPFDSEGNLLRSHSPVDRVASEMQSFVTEIRGAAFSELHPAAQAAYAHWAIVHIHPFADGNGRVARTVASIYLLRAVSIPLLIYSDSRETYLDALTRADAGELRYFVDFVYERAINAMDLASERLRLAQGPTPDEQARRLAGLFRHPSIGGFTHTEVETATRTLLDAGREALTSEVNAMQSIDVLEVKAQLQKPVRAVPIPDGYRRSVNSPELGLVIQAATRPPGEAKHELHFQAFLNIDQLRSDDEIVLRDVQATHPIGFRIGDLYPQANTAAKLRLDAWAGAVLSDVVSEVSDMAAAALKSRGYSMPGPSE